MKKNIFSKIKQFNYRRWWLLLPITAFVVYIFFFDKNNVMKRIEYEKEIAYLKSEIDKYKEKITQDSLQIVALKTDKEAVERVAREKYGYKSPDEDIYVIKYVENEEN